MKKEINQYIFNLADNFFGSFGLKSKKLNGGGVTFQRKLENVKFEGGFGFRFNEYNQIEYFGIPRIGGQFLEVESIYNSLLEKHSINIGSPLTFDFRDYEWREGQVSPTMNLSDVETIDVHTRAILHRFEDYVFPLAEQYLSLPYWVKRYEEVKNSLYNEEQICPFYNEIRDRFKIKHLIILKLCNSPLFEEAYAIKYRIIEEDLINYEDKESEGYKNYSRIFSLLRDLKEILDATQPLYDWQDLTPPFRFTKSDGPVIQEKLVWEPKAVLNGEEIELEINGLDITSEQKQKVEVFLKNLDKHFETTVSELIDNAKFENEGSNYEIYEDCQFFVYSVAEFSGLLKNGVTRAYEDRVAPFIKLNYISVGVEEEQVLFVLGHAGEETINVHLTLDGHVEIITGK